MSFRLLDERIAVLPEKVEERSASGLHLPDSAQEPIVYGTVSHVGAGRRSESTGEVLPIDVEIGDRVFYHRASGGVLKVEGTDYTILGPRDIIGIAEDGPIKGDADAE